jgi:hypothetical protein
VVKLGSTTGRRRDDYEPIILLNDGETWCARASRHPNRLSAPAAAERCGSRAEVPAGINGVSGKPSSCPTAPACPGTAAAVESRMGAVTSGGRIDLNQIQAAGYGR